MGVSRGTESTMVSGRAQSTLIGIVLLLGMVAIGSLGIFLVASDMLTDVEQESEHDRVENSFVELSQQMATASSDDDVSRSMDIDAGEDGAVVMSNTGNLTIKGGDVDKTIPIGAIEYTGDDGTKIAYQAGGVFRETGNETRVVSAPPINYDADSETLSFPIIKTRDEAHLDSGNIHVSHHKTDPLQEASLVENDTVTIKVESEYYRGWEQYFKSQGGPTTIKEVKNYENNDSGVVTAKFGYLDLETSFDSAMTLSDGVRGGPGDAGVNYDENEYRTGSSHELDDVIDDLKQDEDVTNKTDWANGGSLIIDGSEDFSDGYDYIEREGVFPHGTYFAEEINIGDLSFDLSEGNATLVVDGDINIDGGLEVENWSQEENHTLEIYTTGNIDIDGADVCVEPCGSEIDARQLQIFGKSDTHVSIGPGGSTVEAILYVASNREITSNEAHDQGQGKGQTCDAQVCLHSSSVDFHGSIVASSVGGIGNPDIYHDPKLENEAIDIYPKGYRLPPQLTYLNVAEHKVDVEGN